jgi:hypothetical protein
LSKLGYRPNTYGEAEKVSGVVNDKINRVIDETGNSVIDNDLIQDLRILPEDVTFCLRVVLNSRILEPAAAMSSVPLPSLPPIFCSSSAPTLALSPQRRYLTLFF